MDNKIKYLIGFAMMGVAAYLFSKKRKKGHGNTSEPDNIIRFPEANMNYANATSNPCWSMSPLNYANGYCKPRELTIAWYVKPNGDGDWCTIGSERLQSYIANSPGITVPTGTRPKPHSVYLPLPTGNQLTNLCGCPGGVAPAGTVRKTNSIVVGMPVTKRCIP